MPDLWRHWEFPVWFETSADSIRNHQNNSVFKKKSIFSYEILLRRCLTNMTIVRVLGCGFAHINYVIIVNHVIIALKNKLWNGLRYWRSKRSRKTLYYCKYWTVLASKIFEQHPQSVSPTRTWLFLCSKIKESEIAVTLRKLKIEKIKKILVW